MYGQNYRVFASRGVLILAMAALLLVGALPNMAFSCQRAQGSQTPVQLDQPFQLRLQEQVVIAADDLAIQFLEVSEDSRCPSDVQCVWAGQVSVRLQLSTAENPAQQIVLTDAAGPNSQSSAWVDGYHLQLVQVTPYPHTQHPIQINDYTLTLAVTRQS